MKITAESSAEDHYPASVHACTRMIGPVVIENSHMQEREKKKTNKSNNVSLTQTPHNTYHLCVDVSDGNRATSAVIGIRQTRQSRFRLRVVCCSRFCCCGFLNGRDKVRRTSASSSSSNLKKINWEIKHHCNRRHWMQKTKTPGPPREPLKELLM